MRRKLLYACLYFSEGAPIGFLWVFLGGELRSRDVPIEDIGALLGLFALPWALKVFWAPLLDVLRGPRWGYRSWMLLAQAVMGLALLPLVWLDLGTELGLVLAFGLVHAVAAATQDVAIDALAIATVPERERGSVNGWMQLGMRLGISLFGGVALIVSDELGVPAVVLILCAVVWAVGLVAGLSGTLVSPPPPRTRSAREAAAVFVGRLRTLLRRHMLYGLLFALVAGAGFEALAGLASPYLVDRGYDKGDVGAFLAFAAIACLIAGSLYGGRLADRVGVARVAGAGLALLAVTIALVALAPNGAGLFLAFGAFYACIGLFTASSYALFMNLTDPAVAATQFTAFMAMTNLCESGSVYAAGRIGGAAGYLAAFLVLGAVSLAALPLLRPLGAAARSWHNGGEA